MSKAKTLLEGMGINPLEKIDNNCDVYWTLYELIDHCTDQFYIPVVSKRYFVAEIVDKYKTEIISAEFADKQDAEKFIVTMKEGFTYKNSDLVILNVC